MNVTEAADRTERNLLTCEYRGNRQTDVNGLPWDCPGINLCLGNPVHILPSTQDNCGTAV